VLLNEGSGITAAPVGVCLNMPMTWFLTCSGPLGAWSAKVSGSTVDASFALITLFLLCWLSLILSAKPDFFFLLSISLFLFSFSISYYNTLCHVRTISDSMFTNLVLIFRVLVNQAVAEVPVLLTIFSKTGTQTVNIIVTAPVRKQ
jgi:hypothetical protein